MIFVGSPARCVLDVPADGLRHFRDIGLLPMLPTNACIAPLHPREVWHDKVLVCSFAQDRILWRRPGRNVSV